MRVSGINSLVYLVSVSPYGLSCWHTTSQFLHLIFLSDNFWCFCATLWECRCIVQHLLLCLWTSIWPVQAQKRQKRASTSHFSSWCFWPCFCCTWQIIALPYQWRLLTNLYLVMALQFFTCNYMVGKHILLFSKVSTILFTNIGIYGIQWAHIFWYFSFFVTILWAAPYATFTWYTISDNLAFQSQWMIASSLFLSVLSVTKISLPEQLSSTIFSPPLLNFPNHFLTCWTLIMGFTKNFLDHLIYFNIARCSNLEATCVVNYMITWTLLFNY